MRSIYLLIASSVFLLDQLTKWAIVDHFSPDAMRPVVPGLFSLVRVENPGIAFGMLGHLSSGAAFGLIILVSAAAIALVCYLLWRADPSALLAGVALALILGGATGNLVDRIIRGRVVDFLDFYFGTYHWPAFNVADSAICVGAALLVLDLFWGRGKADIHHGAAEAPRS
jgi:signal peptidase II